MKELWSQHGGVPSRLSGATNDVLNHPRRYTQARTNIGQVRPNVMPQNVLSLSHRNQSELPIKISDCPCQCQTVTGSK